MVKKLPRSQKKLPRSQKKLLRSQKKLLNMLEECRNAINIGLYHSPISYDSNTIFYMLCCVVNQGPWNFMGLPFAPEIEETIRYCVQQCVAETDASEHSLLDYLARNIDKRKIRHLMNCSCGCRQLRRTTLSQYVKCACCVRHQK